MKSGPENSLFSTNVTLNIRGRLIDLTHPKVMGVLNVTPDSFFDGGRYQDERSILQQTEKMLVEGATFIDVGAYSSRPGAEDIAVEEERKRAIFCISLISKHFPGALVSIDTFRSDVASAALDEGACVVNDISAGILDSRMLETVGRYNVPFIAMHMRGTPQTMAQQTDYQNIVKDVIDYFHQRIDACRQHGIQDIVVDPGFGFAKTVSQNFELLQSLEYFSVLGLPLLAGLSRKSTIWKTLGVTPAEALNGTTVLNTVALSKGASILRVHDVKEAVEAITLLTAMKNSPTR